MKIDAAIRDAHSRLEPIARALQAEVNHDLQQRKDGAWHYQSRVKDLESFALKVESGRIESLSRVEDMFGATLVVQDAGQIQRAIDVVATRYPIVTRRPPSSSSTKKNSDSFVFDDVRLYVNYERTEGERTAIPNNTLFEVQIKTFLQHAWAVATHDLTYKTALRDWRRERIAYQIKAALEQAEVAIGGIETLASTSVLPASDDQIDELNAIIIIIMNEWEEHDLPTNVRRVAESVQSLLRIVDQRNTADRAAILSELVANGRTRNGGGHSIHWSPYRSVLNYVAQEHPGKLKRRIRSERSRQKLLIYPEVLALLSVSEAAATSVIVAGE